MCSRDRKEIVITRIKTYKTTDDHLIEAVTRLLSLDSMGDTKNAWMSFLYNTYTVLRAGPHLLYKSQRTLISNWQFGGFPDTITNYVRRLYGRLILKSQF